MTVTRPLPAVLTVIVAGLVAYHNSFDVPFLYDDEMSIPRNESIRQLSTALQPPAEAGVGGRPVLNLSYALNYAVGGQSVTGYHAVNMAIHILAGLTLLGILRRTLELPAATVAAVIWTVHPLQTEAVTYLSQRSESLMGLFYLLTLYCFIREWPAASVVACALGMLTKEGMVTAPVAVLLYDRVFVAGSFRAAWRKRRGFYLALAGSWALLAWMMIGVQQRGVGFELGVKWWEYAWTQCRAITQYLRLALWPAPLTFDYGSTELAKGTAALWPFALVVGAWVAGTLVALRRRPAIGFAGAWVVLTLAPTSSAVPIAGSPIAEHRMYLALAGVVALAAAGLFATGKRALSLALTGVIVLALTAATIHRNEDYRSEIAIWSDTVAKRPDNSRAHNNLAIGLIKVGRAQEAMQHFARALEIEPTSALAHNNLGKALVDEGRAAEAISHYEQALRSRPKWAEAHYNLANALVKTGKLPDALAHYETALQLKPDYAEAHYNLGVALGDLGRFDEARAHYEQAVKLSSDSADAHNNLAWALATDPDARRRDPLRAVQLAERACELTERKDAGALDTLAAAYAAAGRFDEAIRTAQGAIELATDAELVADIRARLELYKTGKPFHR